MDPVTTTAAIANSIMMILGILSDERKKALSREYQDVLDNLHDARNAKYPNYATSNVQLSEQRLHNFKLAFYGAIADELKETKK